jgi:hypothetical protein
MELTEVFLSRARYSIIICFLDCTYFEKIKPTESVPPELVMWVLPLLENLDKFYNFAFL